MLSLSLGRPAQLLLKRKTMEAKPLFNAEATTVGELKKRFIPEKYISQVVVKVLQKAVMAVWISNYLLQGEQAPEPILNNFLQPAGRPALSGLCAITRHRWKSPYRQIRPWTSK
jgi:hypothetical protein